MVKITGLDKITRELKEAQQTLAEIDGKLGAVSFDPSDAESIEDAIVAMEQMIDARLGTYVSNRMIAPLAEQMKASYRQAILDKAAAARLEGKTD